jgi:hypothetical protein
LTNSSYHRGDWSSTWNIQSILIAYYSIWLDDSEHGISHITRTAGERAKMAAESKDYNIKNYKQIYEKFDFENLTDDIDNSPKFKPAPKPSTATTTTATTTTATATNTAATTSTSSNTTQAPVEPKATDLQCDTLRDDKSSHFDLTNQKGQTKFTERSEMTQSFEPKTVFSNKLGEKFNEINDNITKINQNIINKEEEIKKMLIELK